MWLLAILAYRFNCSLLEEVPWLCRGVVEMGSYDLGYVRLFVSFGEIFDGGRELVMRDDWTFTD